MYDSTIHEKTIGRQLRKADFKSRVWTVTKSDRPAVIKSATSLAKNGFPALSFKTNKLSGKTIYRHSSLPEALLIRHVSENVRRVTGVKQSDRQAIVKSLRELFKEGVAFNVAKIDIKSFYESVDTAAIVDSLERDPAFSRQSIAVLRSFFERLTLQNIPGLPRGLGLSATLSEYLLRPFDAQIQALEGVKFYSRYVDDIVIVSQSGVPAERLIEDAAKLLPNGLSFNNKKTEPFMFKKYNKNNTGSIEACMSFLGYDFQVGELITNDNKFYRDVNLDIAAKKVSRLKRRMCKAFLAYNNGGSFYDLRDRFKILTCNFGYEDASSGQTRYSGIRYNYSLIDPQTSQALTDLDRFFRNAVTSKHPNNRIRPNLSPVQRRAMLGFSFRRGFIDNVFYTFEENRLKKLVGCWAHA